MVEGHINENFQVKDEHLLQYFHKATQLAAQFKSLKLKYIPMEENTKVDKLSKVDYRKGEGALSFHDSSDYNQTNNLMFIDQLHGQSGRLEERNYSPHQATRRGADPLMGVAP